MIVSARSISTRVASLLVAQANRELDASRMYLSMDLWFRFNDLPGSAGWCQAHSLEERGHAMKIFDHLSERKTEKHCAVTQHVLTDWNMDDFDAHASGGKKVSGVWEMALKNERANTEKYFELTKTAQEEDDFVTRQFVDWFINEQLLEENALLDLYNKANKLEQTGGLYTALDEEIKSMEH